MNLLRNRLQAEWVAAQEGSPVDLLVLPVGAVDPSGFEALAASGAIRLSIATDAAEQARAEAPALQRPLQFEEFSALMLEIEPGLIRDGCGFVVRCQPRSMLHRACARRSDRYCHCRHRGRRTGARGSGRLRPGLELAPGAR